MRPVKIELPANQSGLFWACIIGYPQPSRWRNLIAWKLHVVITN